MTRPTAPARRRILALALLLLLASVFTGLPIAAAPDYAIRNPQSAMAQPQGLTMQVTAGYDSFYKVGEWFPVRVELRNDGNSQVRGVVQVRASNESGSDITTYSREIDLPAPSRKEVTLYSYAASYDRVLDVTLTQGNTALLTQRVNMTPVEYPAYLLGVVSDDAGLLNVLKDEEIPGVSSRGGSQVTVAHLRPADLPPAAAGLAGLDALILAGTNTGNLSTEAHEALTGWVLRGGLLLVGGGANVQATAAGVTDLLPVRVTGTRPATDFAALSAFIGSTTPLQSASAALVATGTPDTAGGAQILAGDPDLPLVVTRSYGLGRVTFLALDPSLPPLREWADGLPLWTRLLSQTQVELSLTGRRRVSNQFGYNYYGGYYGSHPFDIAGLELPNAWLVGGFVLAYLLLLGPINYLVLRLLKRVELAWVTMPALIAIFIIGTYALGVLSKGNSLRLAQASIVHVYPGTSLAAVDSFVGLLSPTRGNYDLSFPGDTPLTELNASASGFTGRGATILLGRPTQVRDLTADTWALRGFLAEGTVAYPAPLTATIRLDNGRLRGRVTNQGSTPLRDAGVLRDNQAQYLGDLEPGQSVEFDLLFPGSGSPESAIDELLPGAQASSYSGLYSSAPGSQAERRALNRRVSVLALALRDLPATDTITLVSWGGPAPLTPQVAGQNPARDDLTLVLADVPLPAGVQGPASYVSLEETLPGWRRQSGLVVGTPENPVVLNLDAGQATLEYAAAGVTYAPDPLELAYDLRALDAPNGPLRVNVQFYSWWDNSFEEVQGADYITSDTDSATGTLRLSPAERYLGPSRQIFMRFIKDAGAPGQIAVRALQVNVPGVPTPVPTGGPPANPPPVPTSGPNPALNIRYIFTQTEPSPAGRGFRSHAYAAV